MPITQNDWSYVDDSGRWDPASTVQEIRSLRERVARLENVLAAPAVSNYTDEQIIAACKAHDKEVAAQMGEPSPWDVSDELYPMGQWESERIAAMRAALAAIAAAPTKGGR